MNRPDLIRARPTLSLPFFAAGFLSLAIALGALAINPGLLRAETTEPGVIALAHLLVLGWLGSLVTGACYQLIPVLTGSSLWRPILARIHLVLHVAGLVGMIVGFVLWNLPVVAIFGGLTAAGMALLVVNGIATADTRPTGSVESASVGLALTWLLITVGFGVFMAVNRIWPLTDINPRTLTALHAHLGLIGFYVQLLVGVSYRLLPMFAVSEMQSPLRAWISIIFLNLGVLILGPAIIGANDLLLRVGTMVVALGLLAFLCELGLIVWRKHRPIDSALLLYLFGVGMFVPGTYIGLSLGGWPLPTPGGEAFALTSLFVVTGLGALTCAVLGMGLKIIPFLIWQLRYAPLVGRQKVPSLANMSSRRWTRIAAVIFGVGVLLLSAGSVLAHELFLQTGCLLLLTGLGAYAVNLVSFASHLLRPRVSAPLSRKRVAS